MHTKRLTQQVVERLEPKAAEYVEWCPKLRGFGCRVRPTGHKSFLAMYRVGGRSAKSRKVTIGTYGKITTEEARKAASKILACPASAPMRQIQRIEEGMISGSS
jgi:hypothetical protein